ncbi:MAG: amidotransferase [Candidatus Hydrogenedens sp.]|nr:amidotransferase [Candidatus Hydrogenedens sp.]
MNVHLLQHVPFEGLGSIETWLEGRRADVSWTRLYEPGASLPAPDSMDLLIALGGPMSVNDEAALPWLVDEKRFIGGVIALGTPVLGICLGAQLIAAASGARVYPGPHREIGWFPVERVATQSDSFVVPPLLEVFHWHGETFDLPDGAVHLARSAGCEHQAFQLGERVIGLQFHLETTPESADAIITQCNDEIVPGTYVQTEDGMRDAPAAAYQSINRVMAEILDYLTR